MSAEQIKTSTSGQRRYQPQFLPRSTKKWVNFGPLTKEFICGISTHPKSIVSETIFRPLEGAGPSNFHVW